MAKGKHLSGVRKVVAAMVHGKPKAEPEVDLNKTYGSLPPEEKQRMRQWALLLAQQPLRCPVRKGDDFCREPLRGLDPGAMRCKAGHIWKKEDLFYLRLDKEPK